MIQSYNQIKGEILINVIRKRGGKKEEKKKTPDCILTILYNLILRKERIEKYCQGYY